MKDLLFLIAGTAAAAHYLPKPAKLCYNFDLTLTVTSENFIFASPKFETNFDVTDFITDLTSRSPPKDFATLLPGKVNQTGIYTISSTFCTPEDTSAAKRTTVLLATHGLNFDRNYWNSDLQPERYNFVDYAINQGYSVFYYDRLGVGSSSIVSGYTNQLPTQVEIAKKLAHIVRSGNYPGSIGKAKSLVLVGHSFGSSISAGVAVSEPDIIDGIIMTGFSYNGSNPINFPLAAQLKIAASYDPRKWGKLDTGYLTLVDIYANINAFLKKPDYDIDVAEYADANKQPIAVSELLTANALGLRPLAFKGVAMVIAGQYDFIFCQSNCDDVIGPASKAAFPNAAAFKAVSYPGSGHALNFALNVTGAYEIIFGYLGKNNI